MFNARDSFFIDGGWAAPKGTETITIINPSTEEVIGRTPEGTKADVDAAVAAARRALEDPRGWGGYTPQQRADALHSLADELDARQGEIASQSPARTGCRSRCRVNWRRTIPPPSCATTRSSPLALRPKNVARASWAWATPWCSATPSAWSPRSCRGTSLRH